MTRRVGQVCAAVFAMVVVAAPGARAQNLDRFADLPLYLDLDDLVTIVDLDDARVVGRLRGLTGDGLTLEAGSGPITFGTDRVRRVERCCDSIRNGAVIGGTIFGGLGLMVGLAYSEPVFGLFAGAAFAGVGAGLGAGFDALSANPVVVYRRRASDVRLGIGVRGRALAATISF